MDEILLKHLQTKKTIHQLIDATKSVASYEQLRVSLETLINRGLVVRERGNSLQKPYTYVAL